MRAPATAVVGFLVGAGSLALPFVYFRSVLISGLGLWVTLVWASCVVPVMLAVGIPLTVAGRPGSRSRAFGAGLVLVLAVLGQLSAWGIGYLWLSCLRPRTRAGSGPG